MTRILVLAVLAAAALAGVFYVFLVLTVPSPAAAASCSGRTVVASWYGPGFNGRKAASGERFNQNALTAAHKTLPFGTRVRVTYKGRSVVVRVNDRGPYIHGRSLDLAKGAAAKIGLIPAGHAPVCMKVLN